MNVKTCSKYNLSARNKDADKLTVKEWKNRFNIETLIIKKQKLNFI